MNIEIIKNKVNTFKGMIKNFKFNGSRNQIEEFSGVIIDTYPSIFLVRLNSNNIVKSFSYSDVLIHKLIIK